MENEEDIHQATIGYAIEYLDKLFRAYYANIQASASQVDMLCLMNKCFTGNPTSWLKLFVEVF